MISTLCPLWSFTLPPTAPILSSFSPLTRALTTVGKISHDFYVLTPPTIFRRLVVPLFKLSFKLGLLAIPFARVAGRFLIIGTHSLHGGQIGRVIHGRNNVVGGVIFVWNCLCVPFVIERMTKVFLDGLDLVFLHTYIRYFVKFYTFWMDMQQSTLVFWHGFA